MSWEVLLVKKALFFERCHVKGLADAPLIKNSKRWTRLGSNELPLWGPAIKWIYVLILLGYDFNMIFWVIPDLS